MHPLLSVLGLVAFASSAQAATPARVVRPAAHPAPFAFTVSATMPSVPASMPTYDIVATPRIPMETLEDVFGVSGIEAFDELGGGVAHVAEGNLHLYAYDFGGAAFHDLDNGFREEAIQPVSDDELWSVSEAVLADLGLFDDPIVTLEPGRTGRLLTEVHEGGGPVTASWTSMQSANWGVRVDGWETFGGGSEVTVYVGDEGLPVGLTSAVRTLDPTGDVTIDSPERALNRFLSTAAHTGRFSVLKTWTGGLTSVDFDRVTLGYWTSDLSSPSAVVVPTYEIHGIVTYAPAPGQTATTELIWYQPAAMGLSIPDLKVTAGR